MGSRNESLTSCSHFLFSQGLHSGEWFWVLHAGVLSRLRSRAEPLLYVTSQLGHQVLLHIPWWLCGVESHLHLANVPYLTVPVQSNEWHWCARCQRNSPWPRRTRVLLCFCRQWVQTELLEWSHPESGLLFREINPSTSSRFWKVEKQCGWNMLSYFAQRLIVVMCYCNFNAVIPTFLENRCPSVWLAQLQDFALLC